MLNSSGVHSNSAESAGYKSGWQLRVATATVYSLCSSSLTACAHTPSPSPSPSPSPFLSFKFLKFHYVGIILLVEVLQCKPPML